MHGRRLTCLSQTILEVDVVVLWRVVGKDGAQEFSCVRLCCKEELLVCEVEKRSELGWGFSGRIEGLLGEAIS